MGFADGEITVHLVLLCEAAYRFDLPLIRFDASALIPTTITDPQETRAHRTELSYTTAHCYLRCRTESFSSRI